MNKEEILAMEAGSELDLLIATKIFNHRMAADGFLVEDNGCALIEHQGGFRTYGEPLEYSTDISAAWQVVEKMREEHWRWHGFSAPDFSGCEFVKQIQVSACPNNLVEALEMPEAICKAALLTKLEGST